MRFGALRETQAMRPPHTVLPKTLDLEPPASVVTAGQDLRIEIFGLKSEIDDWWIDRLQRAPETCIPAGTRFRERTPRR